MLLTSWDTLAFNEQGVIVTSGEFVTPNGVKATFYKNWLYVSDAAAWIPGTFDNPILLHVDAGDFQYRDLHVRAIRGPWNGIYAVCCSGDIGQHFAAMAGIACYGWDKDVWVGVSRNPMKFMQSWLRRRFTEYELPSIMRDVKLETLRNNESHSSQQSALPAL